MAITDNDNITVNQVPTPAPKDAQIHQPATAESKGSPWSFHRQGGMFAAPIGSGLGSESLTKLADALTEIYRSANHGVAITLLVLDNSTHRALAFSSIVVCMREKDVVNSPVGYHTLVIEATGDRIEPRFEQHQGNQVEILMTTDAAYDQVLQDLVKQKVSAAFPNTKVLPVDGSVVPRDFNVESKEAVHALALNAGLAIGTELATKAPGFEDLNLGTAQRDSNLTINVAFSHNQISNAVGAPVRADVLISLNSQQQQNNQNQLNRSINSGDRTVKISEAAGFIDMIWAPVSNQSFSPYQMQQPQQTQKYAARLVLTSLESNFAMTPAAVLMTLLSAMAVREDNNWIQAFLPSPTSNKEIDLYDIGALAIEANFNNDPSGFGARVDTKTETFTLDSLGKLVAALIQPGLVISLDVPVFAPETWSTSIFSAAAVANNQAAYDIIYNAANKLTNGGFGRRFPHGTPMFTDTDNRVHLGYYKDKNGDKRDIRDIGYTAVANYAGDRNPQTIRDWSDTWYRQQYPLAQRLSARKRMISAITRESAEFTGFADRITFTDVMLVALSEGAREAGLAVRVATPLNSADFNNERQAASFIQSALMTPAQSFAHNNPMFNPNMGGNMFGNTGRFNY